MRIRSVATVAALALTLGACSPASTSEESLVAIATTTQLGDVARQVAECAGGTVETLMGPGDDPHDFSVSSAEVARMTQVPLVITNGLGLESGLASSIENAVADGATVLEVAPLLDPIPFEGDGHDHAHEEEHAEEEHAHEDAHAEEEHAHEEHTEDAHDEEEHAHDHGSEDPHFWHDAGRMALAAEEIGAHLAEATGEEKYATCGTELRAELEQLDTEVRDILAAIPAENRVLVSDHAALGYLADAYDFDVVGVVIPGGSTDAEPSSEELAALVETISETGVRAIFSNNAAANALVDAVASEVGEIKVVELYEGSLGEPGSEGDTYQKAALANAKLIADALS